MHAVLTMYSVRMLLYTTYYIRCTMYVCYYIQHITYDVQCTYVCTCCISVMCMADKRASSALLSDSEHSIRYHMLSIHVVITATCMHQYTLYMYMHNYIHTCTCMYAGSPARDCCRFLAVGMATRGHKDRHDVQHSRGWESEM